MDDDDIELQLYRRRDEFRDFTAPGFGRKEATSVRCQSGPSEWPGAAHKNEGLPLLSSKMIESFDDKF